MAVVSIKGRRKSRPVLHERRGADEDLSRPARKRVLTLGGCNLHEAFVPYGDLFETKHLWRAAITNLASPPATLRSVYFPQKAVTDVVYKETTKVLYGVVKAFDGELIAFEAAGEFAYAHLKIGDTIIPDFRTPVFGPECEAVVFPEGSELASAEVLTTNDERYWELWRQYFQFFYQDTLKEKIAKGTKVVFLSRRLCELRLENTAFLPFENLEFINRSNDRLASIEAFVSGFEGVTIVKVSNELLYSSPDSPWTGPWPFHPEKGFYGELRQKLLRVLDMDQQIVDDVVTQERKDRDILQSQYRSLLLTSQGEKADLQASLDKARKAVDELQAKNALLSSYRHKASGLEESWHRSLNKIEKLQGQLAELVEERDQIAFAKSIAVVENGSRQEENSALQEQITIQSQTISELERQSEQYRASLKAVEATMAGLRQRIENDYFRDGVLRYQLAAAKQEVSAGRRTIEGQTAVIEKLQGELAELVEERDQIACAKSVVVAENDQLHDESVSLQDQLTVQFHTISDLQRQAEEYRASMKAVEATMVGMRQRIETDYFTESLLRCQLTAWQQEVSASSRTIEEQTSVIENLRSDLDAEKRVANELRLRIRRAAKRASDLTAKLNAPKGLRQFLHYFKRSWWID
jgi:hypothetical protein